MSVYYKKLIDLYEAGKINEWEICYTYNYTHIGIKIF